MAIQSNPLPPGTLRTVSPSSPRNPGVDLLRLLAIFLVIVLHIDLEGFGIPAAFARMAARWAVPFFFILSGYFAGQKSLSLRDARRKTALKRLLGFVCLGDLLYAPYAWKLGLHLNAPSGVFSHFLISGTAFHLWFLHSLGFGQLLLSLPGTNRNATMLAVALGVPIAFLNGYCTQLKLPEFAQTFLALGYGLPFLGLGLLLRLVNWRPRFCWVLVGVGGAVQLLEFCFCIQSGDLSGASSTRLFCGTTVLSLGLAALAVARVPGVNGGSGPRRWVEGSMARFAGILAHWGSSYILGVYLLHIYVRVAINGVARALHLYQTSFFPPLSPLLVLAGSLGVVHLLWTAMALVQRSGFHREP